MDIGELIRLNAGDATDLGVDGSLSSGILSSIVSGTDDTKVRSIVSHSMLLPNS